MKYVLLAAILMPALAATAKATDLSWSKAQLDILNIETVHACKLIGTQLYNSAYTDVVIQLGKNFPGEAPWHAEVSQAQKEANAADGAKCSAYAADDALMNMFQILADTKGQLGPKDTMPSNSSLPDNTVSSMEDAVRNLTEDPDAVRYRGARVFTWPGSGSYSLCGFILARNSFGAYTGWQRFVTMATPSVADPSQGSFGMWTVDENPSTSQQIMVFQNWRQCMSKRAD